MRPIGVCPACLRPLYVTAVLFLLVAVLFDILIPSRLHPDQAPRSQWGIVRADPFDSPVSDDGVDVIFVHGLGANPDTTWGTVQSEPERANKASNAQSQNTIPKCWVTEFLPQDIPESSRRHIRIFFHNCDTYWKRDSVQTRLRNLGNGLLAQVSSQLRVTQEERSRKLVFVGHSFGGLVIKSALVQAKKNPSISGIAKNTEAILFLGTPHRGSTFSQWGSLVAQALRPLGSNPGILDELAYDSPYLLDLHDDFVHATKREVQVINFFEERPTRLVKIWFMQWVKFCVTESSASYSSPHSVHNIGLPVDHSGLNKFESQNGIYNIVTAKLLEVVSSLQSRESTLYSVPFETIDTYADRHALSSTIDAKLHTTQANGRVSHALVLFGLGGTGKTQLALKFVEEHRSDYNPILWIDATTEDTLRSSFERCANELQLPAHGSENHATRLLDSSAVRAVLGWLRDRKITNDQWLVVIDNADDLTWGIKNFIPRGPRGNVIVTSQDSQAWKLLKGGCEQLEIGMLEPIEARNILLDHLKKDQDSEPQNFIDDCDKVTDLLGRLALAVNLAGAHIANYPNKDTAVEQYLEDYKSHRSDLLRNEDFRDVSSYEKTVWTAWDTTLSRVEKQHPDLRPRQFLGFLARFGGLVIKDELFRLASFTFPVFKELTDEKSSIPEWLDQLLTMNDQLWDSYYHERSCDILARYSMLQRVDWLWGKGVRLHGLVRWRATEQDQSPALDHVYYMFLAAAAYSSVLEQRHPFRRYVTVDIPDDFMNSISKFSIARKVQLDGWLLIGRTYVDQGYWNKAEDLFVHAIETTKSKPGAEHLDITPSMLNLIVVYQGQKKWHAAAELGWQVMEKLQMELGVDDPTTLMSMNSLAETYKAQGRWGPAESLLLQVMGTRETRLGADHPDTLYTAQNLASMYMGQGKLELAEQLAMRVVEAQKKVLGAEHHDTLASMHNLATLYLYQGRWKEAEELEVQVLKTAQRMLRKHHPYELLSIEQLARAYAEQHRVQDAGELFAQAAEIRKNTLGEEDVEMHELFETYIYQDQWKDAETSGMQLLRIKRSVPGETYHLQTSMSWSALAFIRSSRKSGDVDLVTSTCSLSP